MQRMQEFGINDHKIIERGNAFIWKKGRKALPSNGVAAADRSSAKAAAEAGRRRSAGRSAATACGERLPKKLASLGFGRRATPAQKTQVVQKLRQKHALSILLSIAQLPRATFYYHLKQMQKEDKYASVKEEITTIYHENKGRYGYRRITTELHKRNFLLNHKTVQRLMKELGLVCRVRMKKYRSYKGEVGKIAPNLLNRDFRAEKPNQKWVTDVTEFSLFGEKLYLSPILDLCSSDLVSYTISDHPVLSMVTTMLDKAFEKIPDGTGLILPLLPPGLLLSASAHLPCCPSHPIPPHIAATSASPSPSSSISPPHLALSHPSPPPHLILSLPPSFPPTAYSNQPNHVPPRPGLVQSHVNFLP